MKMIAVCVLATGCLVQPGGGGGDDGQNQAQKDVDQWNQLVAQYDARRTMFLGPDVAELAPVGDQVFWYDTTSYAYQLDRYDDTSHAQLAYTFPVGDVDTANYRASQTTILTADPSSDPVVYHAYAADSAEAEIANITRPQPPDAQWDAYAIDGSTAYLVDASTPGQTTLLRWQPGAGDPTPVTTLESAGVQVGEFEDFDVSGNTMVFVESGRVWKLDLASNHATWLMNMTELSGAVEIDPDGIMFSTASGLVFYDNAQAALISVSDEIDANTTWQPNQTFATASSYDQDFARWGSYVIYIGQDGVFAYDMAHDAIAPIVLSPDRADLRIDYRYPVVLDDGTLYVTGLTSNDGAIGADGPTYAIDLATILPAE
ncbi:MAG TPA: hypothetical protein VLX92_16995 [Kofleriaceae bacterium]|nr:hypothetical protein [Kofleriaceae bacterium]